MKLYILRKDQLSQNMINMIEVIVTEVNPFVRIVADSDFELINAIFSEFTLPQFDDHRAYQFTRHNLSYEQMLALIISTCLPVEAGQTSSYIDLSLPVPKDTIWLPLTNPINYSNSNWMHFNCKIVADYQYTALTLGKRIRFQDNLLKTQYDQFVRNCSIILTLRKPYHPLLPSPAFLYEKLTREKKLDLLSDHLPQLYFVGPIICLNWNIMHPALGYGYSPYTDSTEIDPKILPTSLQYETAKKEQINKRAKHIQQCLNLMVKQQEPHLITLQENFLEEEQLNNLCSINSNWKFMFSSASPREVILFDSSKLHLLSHLWQRPAIPVLTAEFRTTENDNIIVVHNVHFHHNILPFETEEITLKLLLNEPRKTVLVIGNFDSQIPPLHSEEKPIISAVTPKLFRSGIQGCDWTDGCFTLQVNHAQPQQIDGEILDPLAGDKFRDKQYTVQKYINVTLGQRVELLRLRPYMDMTKQYKTHSIGNVSLPEIESQLCKALEDPALKVRLAVNAFNQRGYVIVSNALENYKRQGSQEIVTHIDDRTQLKTTTLCCNPEKFTAFYEMVLKSKTKRVLYSFGTSFSSKETVFLSDASITDNLMSLSSFLEYLPEEPDSVDTYRQIRKKLIGISNGKSEVTQLCARLVLANYYLHFTEYDEIERANMGNPKCLLLRPTHFQCAMGEYLEICKKFSNMNINTFLPLQRQIIKANLIELGKNIATVYGMFSGRLEEQLVLFEKRVSKKQQAINKEAISKSVSELEKTYRQVLACQNILCSNDLSPSANIVQGASLVSALPLLNGTPFSKPSSAPSLLSPSSSTTSPATHSSPQLAFSPAIRASNAPAASALPVEPSAEEKGARSLAEIQINQAPINLVNSFLHKIYPVKSASVIASLSM